MASFDRKALAPVRTAVSSQHGFHVRSSVPPIQEASQAEEERGDAALLVPTPAQWQPWRSPHAGGAPEQQARVRGMLSVAPPAQLRGLHAAAARMQQEEAQQGASGSAGSAGSNVGWKSSSSSSHVEVLTAHSSSGVRRLVKSVVRGLRACQVPYFLLHAPATKYRFFMPYAL
jgi:hypothetical protein